MTSEAAAEREQRIISVLLALGDGEVTTYGDVADVAGYRRKARLVGRILRETDVEVPWWRVVEASGRLRSGDLVLQSELLADEGVVVDEGRERSGGKRQRLYRPVSCSTRNRTAR